MIALAAHRHPISPSNIDPGTSALVTALGGQFAALALDYLETGVLVLDANLRIHFASAAARRLLETGRLCARNGLLSSPVDAEAIRLRRIVKQYAEAASAGSIQMTFHRLGEVDDVLCLGFVAVRVGRLCVRQAVRDPLCREAVRRPASRYPATAQSIRPHPCTGEAGDRDREGRGAQGLHTATGYRHEHRPLAPQADLPENRHTAPGRTRQVDRCLPVRRFGTGRCETTELDAVWPPARGQDNADECRLFCIRILRDDPLVVSRRR